MKLEVFIIILLIFSVGASFYFLYPLYFGHPQDFQISSSTTSVSISSNYSLADGDWPGGMLFYDNIRYSNNIISYSLDTRCDSKKIGDVREAFNTISSESILEFNEISDGGEIFVSCPPESERPNENVNLGHYIAGEGGPSSVINTSSYYLITNGSIMLYSDNKCERSVVSIHELLHALGFQHSSNKLSIMYNISSCSQQITADIVERINTLYKDPSLSDLTFIDGSASSNGRYVNFKIEVINSGLADSENFNLKLYINGKEFENYEVENLEPGSGKIFKVDNLFFLGKAEKLEFVADPENQVMEINEGNNKLDMEIP